MIRCPACNADNPDKATYCARCGVALVCGAALRYIAMAERSIQHGDIGAAQEHLDQACAALEGLAKRQGSELVAARARWLQGVIYYHRAQTDAAAREVHSAVALIEGKEGSKPLLAEAFNTLGNIEYLHGQMSAAQDYYWQALQIAEPSHAAELTVKLWTNLGNISVNEGRSYEALFRYNKAAQYADGENNPALQVMCYRMLAYMYLVIGPFTTAMEYVRRILDLLPQIENHSQLCLALIAVGVVNRYYGDFATAQHYLEAALAIADSSDNQVGRADVLAKLGQLHLDAGDYQACYAVAHKLFTAEATPLIFKKQAAGQLAQCYIAERDFVTAQECVNWILKFEREEDYNDHLYLPVALYFAAMGDWIKATQNFEAALEQSRKRGDSYELARTYQEYAIALTQRDGEESAATRQMLEQAAACFRKIGAMRALATVERLLQEQQVATML